MRTSGLEIAYERAGDGPPLVFVHGAASDARLWRPQVAAFADEFTVVAWDEPGAGRSSDVPAQFGLAEYAGWKGSLPPEEVRARVTGAYRALAVPAEEFDPARALSGWFAGDPRAEFLPLLEEMAAGVRPESLRAALLVMSGADQRDLLPRISVPTLLIWGELDARSPLSVARQFEHAVPDAKLVVIPGAGHVSNLEQPELFNDAVRAFCRAHVPRLP